MRWFSNASVKQTFEEYDLRRPTVPLKAALARLFSARNGAARNVIWSTRRDTGYG